MLVFYASARRFWADETLVSEGKRMPIPPRMCCRHLEEARDKEHGPLKTLDLMLGQLDVAKPPDYAKQRQVLVNRIEAQRSAIQKAQWAYDECVAEASNG